MCVCLCAGCSAECVRFGTRMRECANADAGLRRAIVDRGHRPHRQLVLADTGGTAAARLQCCAAWARGAHGRAAGRTGRGVPSQFYLSISVVLHANTATRRARRLHYCVSSLPPRRSRSRPSCRRHALPRAPRAPRRTTCPRLNRAPIRPEGAPASPSRHARVAARDCHRHYPP